MGDFFDGVFYPDGGTDDTDRIVTTLPPVPGEAIPPEASEYPNDIEDPDRLGDWEDYDY